MMLKKEKLFKKEHDALIIKMKNRLEKKGVPANEFYRLSMAIIGALVSVNEGVQMKHGRVIGQIIRDYPIDKIDKNNICDVLIAKLQAFRNPK